MLPFDKQVPSANAIFFHGDRVRETRNHVIERVYDLQKVAEIIVSKFGNSVNAWVVEASLYNGPFAVYKDFVPSVNQWGEPKSYSSISFPASSSILSLLSSCLKEVVLLFMLKLEVRFIIFQFIVIDDIRLSKSGKESHFEGR